MAVGGVTLLNRTTLNSNTSVTSASLTTTANTVLVVLVTGAGNGTNGQSMSITDTLGTLTWTRQQSPGGTGNVDTTAVFVARSPGAVTGTVTCSLTGITGAGGFDLQVLSVTGARAAFRSTAAATNNGGAAGTAPAMTLSAAPITSSLVFTVGSDWVGSGGSPAVPTGYTATGAAVVFGQSGGAQAAYASTATQTVQWTGNDVNGSLVAAEVPQNNPPTAPASITPNGGESFDTSLTVSWGAASDPDNDPFNYEVEISANNGASWTVLATGINTTTYTFSTAAYTAGSQYLVRVLARDIYLLAGPYRTSAAVFSISHGVNSVGILTA